MARVLRYGEQSVLVEDIDPSGFLTPLRQVIPEAKIRAGLTSLLLTFPEPGEYLATVEALLKTVEPDSNESSGKRFTIPVEYVGEDLAVAAQLASVTVEELISAHTAITWKVKLIGFAPGFPYLVPVTDSENSKLLAGIGRLAVPRRQVPAGSVGLAAGMSCIYPAAMPGGWHLIGISRVSLFDVGNSEKPNLLAIGDLVSFEAAN